MLRSEPERRHLRLSCQKTGYGRRPPAYEQSGLSGATAAARASADATRRRGTRHRADGSTCSAELVTVTADPATAMVGNQSRALLRVPLRESSHDARSSGSARWGVAGAAGQPGLVGGEVGCLGEVGLA